MNEDTVPEEPGRTEPQKPDGPAPSGDPGRPDGPAPSGDPAGQDMGARHARHLGGGAQPAAASGVASDDPSGVASGNPSGNPSGPDDGGTSAQRLGRQALAWGKEILTIIVIAVVLSFLIKTFLFRAFYIPSGSMENTLRIDDRIFVNLLVPKPVAIERGDVVVFKDTQGWLGATGEAPSNWVTDVGTFIGLVPDSSQQHLVKRVIGLPGDKVACCDNAGKLTINGHAITEPYLYPGAAPSDSPFDWTVPEGHLWVMGDHRNNSQDSRYHQAANGTGFVPIDSVEGRALVIAWPLSHWGILGNHPDVFTDVPAPKSASVSSPAHAPAGQ